MCNLCDFLEVFSSAIDVCGSEKERGLGVERPRDFFDSKPFTLAINATSAHFSIAMVPGGVAAGVIQRELGLPTRGLKFGFQVIIHARNLRKNSFPFRRGVACSDGDYSPLALSWCHPFGTRMR